VCTRYADGECDHTEQSSSFSDWGDGDLWEYLCTKNYKGTIYSTGDIDETHTANDGSINSKEIATRSINALSTAGAAINELRTAGAEISDGTFAGAGLVDTRAAVGGIMDAAVAGVGIADLRVAAGAIMDLSAAAGAVLDIKAALGLILEVSAAGGWRYSIENVGRFRKEPTKIEDVNEAVASIQASLATYATKLELAATDAKIVESETSLGANVKKVATALVYLADQLQIL
jgi:hypothetical protein